MFVANMPLPESICHGSITTRGFRMKGCQLPIISNTATTGHKLQGSSVDELFVHSWNYSTNWVYVVLSRVRTMQGLHFRQRLHNTKQTFHLPERYKELIKHLKNKNVAMFNDEQRCYKFGWKEGDTYER